MKTSFLLAEQLDLILAALTEANRLVAQVMLHTGLRVGDVVGLRSDQIAGRFTVREQKTGKSRRVSIPPWLVDAIKAHAAGSEWAFPSPKDPSKHRTRQAVWADIKRAQKAFRLPVNAGSHSLRKVYAVDLMRRYGDIRRVQRALNHDNETVTLLYAMADQLMKTAPQRRKRR